MEYSEALAHKIEARITELKTEIDAHERALAALRGRAGAAPSSATASNGRRRGAAKRTRAAATKSDGATAKSALALALALRGTVTAPPRGGLVARAAAAAPRPKRCSTPSKRDRIRHPRSPSSSACRPQSFATASRNSRRRDG